VCERCFIHVHCSLQARTCVLCLRCSVVCIRASVVRWQSQGGCHLCGGAERLYKRLAAAMLAYEAAASGTCLSAAACVVCIRISTARM
jgi:hypothetical protein